MKCPKCGFEYEDSFKFCPNCSETNPLTMPPPTPPVTEPPVAPEPPPVEPPKEKPPKKKLSERAKPVFTKVKENTKVKEKTNKKTIIIGAVILVVVIAAIVVPIILTRPSYPETISLGNKTEGDLTINKLTLQVDFRTF